MSASFRLRTAIAKEFRAGLAIWLTSAALLTLAALLGQGRSDALRMAVYFLGTIALGASSIGHEYSSGTLTLLLSQPTRRERTFVLKLVVLAVMVVTLLGVWWLAPASLPAAMQIGSANRVGSQPAPLIILISLLCGVCIAPWFTMLSRSALGGIVFTIATPGLLVLVSEISAAMKYGSDPSTMLTAIALKTAILSQGMIAVAAIAAVCGWRQFMHLEAFDGPGQAMRLPWQSLRSTDAAAVSFVRRNPAWLLVRKELRLQQLSFVVAGLYVFGWFAILSVRTAIPDTFGVFLFALTVLQGLAISLLAGSLASAQERQLGTHQWHTLLPTSTRLQWNVKALVAVGVAIALGLGVPTLLIFLTRSPEIRAMVHPPLSSFPAILTVTLLSVTSLYVSSICASSVQALLASLAVGFGVITFANGWFALRSFRLALDPFVASLAMPGRSHSPKLTALVVILNVLGIGLYLGCLFLLLRFGRTNHRVADRSRWRISRQLVSIGTFAALVVFLLIGVSKSYRAEAEEYGRAWRQGTFATVTFAATDAENRPATQYTVVVFPEDRGPRRSLPSRFDSEDRAYRTMAFGTILVPGTYSVIAVPQLERGLIRDQELIGRLKAHATPVTITAGDSKTLNLRLFTY